MSRQLQKLAELAQGRALRNFFHLGLNQAINLAIALIVTPYLFQTLGEAEFGLVNLALSVTYLFAIIVGYGFNLNGPKHIAIISNNREELQSYISNVLTTRLLIGLLLCSVILLLVFTFNIFSGYGILLVFSLTILLSESIFPHFIFQGLEELKWMSLANILAKTLYGISVFLFIKSQSDSLWVNFSFGLSGIIANLGLILFVYSKFRWGFILPKLGELISSVRDNFHFFISTIAGHISLHGGLVVLANFVDDDELGEYALAQRVAFLLRTIPMFIAQAILQNASRLYHKNDTAFLPYLRRTYLIGLVFSILLGLGVFATSGWIIKVVGGEFVERSSDLLKLLGFLPFLGMLNIINWVKIIVMDKQQILAKTTWITTVLMMVLSMVGSNLYGSMGLTIALLATELASYLVHSYYIKAH